MLTRSAVPGPCAHGPGTRVSSRARAAARNAHVLIALAAVHDCAYILPMRYEWDPAKAQADEARHGVRFADAVSVFADLIPARKATRSERNQYIRGER